MKKLFTSSALWSCLVALAMMLSSQSAMAEYVKLTALSGTGGTGGEGYASLVDAKTGTKMGHSFDPSNPDRAEAWIVVKAAKAVVPEWTVADVSERTVPEKEFAMNGMSAPSSIDT